MNTPDLLDRIAAVAHECWCVEMRREGWRHGDRLDESQKTHDGLRPYRELSAFDRDQLRLRVGWDELEGVLARSVMDAMMERELSEQDVHVGMPVYLSSEPSEIGHIDSWTVADATTGRLDKISVRWPDGSVCSYCPTERSILPVRDE